MADEYDLIVIGAGSAGLPAAGFGARVGASVLLVERDRVGGECTWSGCIPSKTLLHAAQVAQVMRQAARVGIRAVEPEVDLAAVMGAVRATIDRVYHFESPEELATQGISLARGQARFLDAHTLDVAGRPVKAKRFVVATGAGPALPAIPGLAEVPYLTYEHLFELDRRPAHLIVLGGGPTGVELAQAFLRLGSKVTVLEAQPRILPAADPRASELLAACLTAEGMTIVTRCRIEAASQSGPTISVSTSQGEVAGDALLVAVGREPRINELGLERAGVAVDGQPARITVDDQLQTSQPHVYAAGDVTGSFQFTHYAGFQGFQAARNALLPGAARGRHPSVPWVVFTEPEVGQVGFTEDQARQRFGTVQVHRWPMDRVDRAQTQGHADGFLQVITQPDGAIVGASVVAGLAGPFVNELSVAIEAHLKLPQLAATIHAYPTYGFGIQQLAAEDALQRATTGLKGKLLRGLVR